MGPPEDGHWMVNGLSVGCHGTAMGLPWLNVTDIRRYRTVMGLI